VHRDRPKELNRPIGFIEHTWCLNSFDRIVEPWKILHCKHEAKSEQDGAGQVRRVTWAGGLILATTMVGVSAAEAVDLRNRDRAAHEVTINHSDGRSETFKIGAGQQRKNVCSDCVILTATSSVEVKGNATVKIERGEVSIDGKR